MKSKIPFLIIFTTCLCCQHSPKANDHLIRITNGPGDEFDASAGYINSHGDTVISIGKYLHCYTDTLKHFAVVMKKSGELIAIDKNDRELFRVFPYDNGPDYLSEGLFRIVKNGKIGYADSLGRIIIEPQFACAHPFENGRARVSLTCRTVTVDEHSEWHSEEWFYINKHGKKL